MDYDYKEGKRRILELLNDPTDIEEVTSIPSDKEFTYDNGYYGWVTALFVDIRESTKLFAENKKSSTARIIRCFTSEIIEILKNDSNLREIGIRGDCVYAIYSSNKIKEDIEILDKAFYINTYLKMLNTLLSRKKMPEIKAGVGIATHQDLVIKAGRVGSGINNKVWIGRAVTYASKLSNKANKDGLSPILFTKEFYDNIIKRFKEENSNYKDNWFVEYTDKQLGKFYGCSLIKSEFDKWIDGGME